MAGANRTEPMIMLVVITVTLPWEKLVVRATKNITMATPKSAYPTRVAIWFHLATVARRARTGSAASGSVATGWVDAGSIGAGCWSSEAIQSPRMVERSKQ